MDRLEALRILIGIADLGGFSAAARELRISPQVATRAIANLEEQLGVQLLQRTTRSVRLTDEGANFLPRCRTILAEMREAELAVMGARSEPQGTLVVTAPVAFGRIHVVPVVSAILRNHPRLSVRLMLVDRSIQLVEEGMDVAVRIGELPDSALRSIKVGEVKETLVASPDYLDARGAPTSTADLRNHELIVFTSLSTSDEWRFGADGKRVVRVRPRLLVNTADAAIAAAQLGLGITRVMSYQASAAIAAGRLRVVLQSEQARAIPISLLFQASRRDSPTVRSFLDGAKDYFRSATL